MQETVLKFLKEKKKTILSLFTHPYVNPNQAFISPTEHKRKYFEEH